MEVLVSVLFSFFPFHFYHLFTLILYSLALHLLLHVNLVYTHTHIHTHTNIPSPFRLHHCLPFPPSPFLPLPPSSSLSPIFPRPHHPPQGTQEYLLSIISVKIPACGRRRHRFRPLIDHKIYISIHLTYLRASSSSSSHYPPSPRILLIVLLIYVLLSGGDVIFCLFSCFYERCVRLSYCYVFFFFRKLVPRVAHLEK